MLKIKKFIKALHEEKDWRVIIFHSSWSLTLASGLSYFFGFIRDRIFAQTFGLSRTLDIYNAAFVIPDLLLSVLIGTALSAAFIPIFTKQYDEKKELGFAYAHQVMSWGLLIVSSVALVVGIFLPSFTHLLVPGFEGEALEQYILLTRILLVSPLIFTISNIYGRILLSVKEFLWFGLSPALYNLGIVLGVVFLVPRYGLIGLVIGTLFGVLLHLSIRLIMVRRRKYNFKHKLDFRFTPEIKETLLLMAPKIIQYLMWNLMVLSFVSIASQLAEGSVAVYGYARNFQSIPVSLLGIAISLTMYTSLSHDAGKGNFKKFKADFKQNRLRSGLYTTVAAIALALLSEPLVRLLLSGGQFGETEIRLLTTVIQIYAIAVPLESMLHIYHRSFYSLKNTIIPSSLHAVNILLTIGLAKTLAFKIGIYAIPISFATGLAIHVILLATIFPFLLKKREAQWR